MDILSLHCIGGKGSTPLGTDAGRTSRTGESGAERPEDVASPISVDPALEFLGFCDATSDPAMVVESFLATIKSLGFQAAACGAWAGVGKNRKNRFFFLDWPPEWAEFYHGNDFFDDDFMVIEARRRITPYLWSDVAAHAKLTGRQRELHDAAVAFGWREALAIPIHGPNSLQGLVTLATLSEVNLEAAQRALLHAMSIAVFERCRTSTSFGMSDPTPVALSRRELECLQWVAAGKTDWEIAQLLGIKPVTAHYHIERAKAKFGVKTRVEAVAAGVLSGLV